MSGVDQVLPATDAFVVLASLLLTCIGHGTQVLGFGFGLVTTVLCLGSQ